MKEYLLQRRKNLQDRIAYETETQALATLADLRRELQVVELALVGLEANGCSAVAVS